ncbi:MAG TPA: hypothetical protein VK993_08220 [Chthoniobacterales bacterium]|nr:hypothetical protein [Chthoniobacterales bacterium]
MIRTHLDKIGSVTRNLRLGRQVTLTETIEARPGAVVVGRIRGDKSVYNQLEDVHGRLSVLHDGDVIVGALGHRNALQGYEGVVPKSVRTGDALHLLNVGGVIGSALSGSPDVGAPFEVEVLGQALSFPEFGSRVGQPAFIDSAAVKGKPEAKPVPVIYIAGTCMNAGKTHAACALVRRLSQEGFKIGGAKLTGVSLLRDILSMRDYGADAVLDFTDAGVACTGPATSAKIARVILSELAARDVDLIIAETGDGIMGEYGVQTILTDPELQAWGKVHILCANDPVGVAGAVSHFRAAFGLEVDVVTGPATDNRVGTRFVETLGLPAANARSNAKQLGDIVLSKLRPHVTAAHEN